MNLTSGEKNSWEIMQGRNAVLEESFPSKEVALLSSTFLGESWPTIFMTTGSISFSKSGGGSEVYEKEEWEKVMRLR